jgi:hypothetical protein
MWVKYNILHGGKMEIKIVCNNVDDWAKLKKY